jgi:hypothetical protein
MLVCRVSKHLHSQVSSSAILIPSLVEVDRYTPVCGRPVCGGQFVAAGLWRASLWPVGLWRASLWPAGLWPASLWRADLWGIFEFKFNYYYFTNFIVYLGNCGCNCKIVNFLQLFSFVAKMIFKHYD